MLTVLWMQKDVISIDKETTLSQAKEFFDQNNFRHLPVLEGKTLAGIVTRNDINNALPSALDSSLNSENRIIAGQIKISAIMTTDPFTAHPMDPLEKVAIAMQRFKINALPVVEDTALIGLITITNICHAFAEILGAEEPGTRIELQIDKNSEAIYTIISICSDFEMSLISITLYKNYSAEHQLVTLKVTGENMDELIDGLWNAGAKINQIIKKP